MRKLQRELGMEGGASPFGGIALGSAIVLVLFALAFAVGGAGGVPTRVVGQVTGFTLRESEEGSYPVAITQVGGRQVLVPLPRATTCRRGDLIHLLRYKALLGFRYRSEVIACPTAP